MKKSELKSIIKECVKEVLFEEGVLSNLVAEVAFGITKAQKQLLSENRAVNTENEKLAAAAEKEKRRQKLLETKKKMLNAIGNEKLSHAFEGTEPLRNSDQSPGASPMAGRDPRDAGVDIRELFNLAGQKWQHLK